MPNFIIEDFADKAVEVTIPIEEVPSDTIYQMLLAGDPEAVAYVQKIGVDALIAKKNRGE